jgi:hypothetical protein
MQLYARVEAFTMLGVVHLATTVRSDSPGSATELVLALSTDVPDDGETDPRAWLRDALVALLEAL